MAKVVVRIPMKKNLSKWKSALREKSSWCWY